MAAAEEEEIKLGPNGAPLDEDMSMTDREFEVWKDAFMTIMSKTITAEDSYHADAKKIDKLLDFAYTVAKIAVENYQLAEHI